MTKQKKPTMMEVRYAISGIMQDLVRLDSKLSTVDKLVNMYIDFQGDGDKFKNYIQKELEKIEKKEVKK